MMMFGNRRPRGFHHSFIYSDNRRHWYKDAERGKGGQDSGDADSQTAETSRRLKMAVPRSTRENGNIGLTGSSMVLFALLFLFVLVAVYILL